MRRSKRKSITLDEYRLMELVSRSFKAKGLRKEMNENMNKYYKSIANRYEDKNESN